MQEGYMEKIQLQKNNKIPGQSQTIPGANSNAIELLQREESEQRRLAQIRQKKESVRSALLPRKKCKGDRMPKIPFQKTNSPQPLSQVSHASFHAIEILHAEEYERQRLTQVLHDGLQPILIGIKLHLAALHRVNTSKKIAKALKHADEMLAQGIALSRSLAIELSPQFSMKLAWRLRSSGWPSIAKNNTTWT